jgi:hypothetical protein
VDDLRPKVEREAPPGECRRNEDGPASDGTRAELFGDVARISTREPPAPRGDLRDARAELGRGRIERALDRRVVEGGDGDADRPGAGRRGGEQRGGRDGDEN